MPTTITVNVKDLTPEAVKALQDRFGNADLEIKVYQAEEDSRLSEEECWALIDVLDWTYEDEDDDKVVAPLVDKLSSLSVANIYQFADWLAEKLWRLDTAEHARVFLEEDGFLSVDDFLYARCAVVANGSEFYYQVLNHPSEMPIDVTFESLLYLPQEAYLKKTGEKMIHVPLFNYETYSNRQGWDNQEG